MQNTEIEHKYLVRNTSYRQMATHVFTIRQGYLSTDPDRTIRIRQRDNQAFITIKSRPDNNTFARFEWEKEIDLHDAQELLNLCLPDIIDKQRYIIPWQGLTIEVDEFHGTREGLCLAEIELQNIKQQLPDLPDFIGEDVSNDIHYSNAWLSNPSNK